MQLRLECYPEEQQRALSAIREMFCVKSVSKGYPNTRQTNVEGTPCEYRYYVTLDDKTPVKTGASQLDLLTLDMLRFLAFLQDTYGHSAAPEIESLRRMYGNASGMTDQQVLQLFLKWKAALLARCAGRKGG